MEDFIYVFEQVTNQYTEETRFCYELGYYTDFIKALDKWVELEEDIFQENTICNFGYFDEENYYWENGEKHCYPDNALDPYTGKFAPEWADKIYLKKENLREFLIKVFAEDGEEYLCLDGHYFLDRWHKAKD